MEDSRRILPELSNEELASKIEFNLQESLYNLLSGKWKNKDDKKERDD